MVHRTQIIMYKIFTKMDDNTLSTNIYHLGTNFNTKEIFLINKTNNISLIYDEQIQHF